jgi:hypothetical protein
VALREEVVLGRAVAALDAAGLSVLTCREERSEIEAAFLFLTEQGAAEEGRWRGGLRASGVGRLAAVRGETRTQRLHDATSWWPGAIACPS